MAHAMDTTMYIYLIEQGNSRAHLTPGQKRLYIIMDQLGEGTYNAPADGSEKVELIEKRKGYKKYRIQVEDYETFYEIITK